MTYNKALRKHVLYILLCAVSFSAAHGQEKALANRLNSRLEGETHVKGRDLVHTLTLLSERLAVPLGLEVTTSPEMLIPFSRSWKDATVRQVIADVVNAYPTYYAEYDGGVVQVRSRQVPLELGVPILDLHIDAFTANNEMVAVVNRRLLKIAEKAIANEAEKAKVVEGLGDAGSFAVGAGGATRVTFTIERGTLRSALNTMAREAKQIWIMAYPEQPNVLNGYLETVYVHLKQDVPRDRRPAWLVIPYGIEIVSRAGSQQR